MWHLFIFVSTQLLICQCLAKYQYYLLVTVPGIGRNKTVNQAEGRSPTNPAC